MRADGRRTKGLTAIEQAIPHIMPKRVDAQNYVTEYVDEEIIKGLGQSTFSDAFTFALLIIVLCVKPTGLFGEKVTDKV